MALFDGVLLAPLGEFFKDLIGAFHSTLDPIQNLQRQFLMHLRHGGAAVTGEDHVEAPIPGIAHRRLNTIIGYYAGHDQCVDRHITHYLINCRSIEDARSALCDNKLILKRGNLIENILLAAAGGSQQINPLV